LLTETWQAYDHLKPADAQAHARTAAILAESILEASAITNASDARYIEQVGKRGIQIATENQLPRLVESIEALLKTVLD
jgi:hypothetical protein